MTGRIIKLGVIGFVGVLGFMLLVPSGMTSLLFAAVAIVAIGGKLR